MSLPLEYRTQWVIDAAMGHCSAAVFESSAVDLL